MVATQTMTGKAPVDKEINDKSVYRRLGIVNGFFIGIALTLGAWLVDAFNMVQLPLRLQYPSMVLGGLLLILICTLAGWLSSRWSKIGLTLLLWLLAAILSILIIVFQPSIGRNLITWLSDNRFWGLPIYPRLDAPFYAIAFAGFAIFLVLMILAVIEGYRLESAQRELNANNRMSGRSLFILIWPLLFVGLAGYVTNDIAGDKSVWDALLVRDAIDIGQTYEGDLFKLGLEKGANYSAVNSVRDQLSPSYSLLIGEVSADGVTTFVVAHFIDGAWITCRLINHQLSYCYDATPPYTIGLTNLITGAPLPEECQGCSPVVEQETADWLLQQSADLGENPRIGRLAQWGSYVLMEVRSESGDYAIECLFSGMSPVQIEHCQGASP